MAEVEPMKSASAWTAGVVSGWTITSASGWTRICSSTSRTERDWCVGQQPSAGTGITSIPVRAATYAARFRSGAKITRSAPSDSTTRTAFAEVQQIPRPP